MKTKFLTFTLLVVSSLMFAQDKQSLKIATEKMIDKYLSGDPGAIASTMYPKIFGVTSKEEMLKAIKNDLKNKDYTSSRLNIDPSIDYGEIIRSESGSFCIISYNIQTKVVLNQKPSASEEKEMEKRLKALLKTEKIHYDKQSMTYNAKKRVQTVALMDSSTKNQWAFVPLDDSDYVKKVLPGGVKKAIAKQ